ncbi:hypothetical protein KM043_012058 [Ampulex compressa]|nr:hypothetical protein KM043_012058 [Ampulex compressa]
MNVPRNVTTAVGQTAFLHCRVHQLGDKEEIVGLSKSGCTETSAQRRLARLQERSGASCEKLALSKGPKGFQAPRGVEQRKEERGEKKSCIGARSSLGGAR